VPTTSPARAIISFTRPPFRPVALECIGTTAKGCEQPVVSGCLAAKRPC
jgi:hypothetical protein